MKFSFESKSESQTRTFGAKLAKRLKPSDVVCLTGPLGSGKTTLTKGMAKALGIDPSDVHSPTFTLMNIYEGKLPLYHFDFYRIDKPMDTQALGLEEFLYAKGVCVIEWAERLKSFLPPVYLKVEAKHKNEKSRTFTLYAKGKRAKDIIENLKV